MHPLQDILSDAPLVTVAPATSTFDAAEKMVKERVGAVLVVDDAGHPQGIFTERDLMRRVVVPGKDPRETLVQDEMTTDLFCAEPSERIDETAREMRKRHIRHLPIVEDGKVIAMLSFRDLLSAHLSEAENEVEAITSYIQGGLPEMLEGDAAEEESEG